MQGQHLTADLYQCTGDSSIFIDEHALAHLCREQTQQSGLTIVGEKWVTFPEYQGEPGGVTGAILLAESHLAIHTWPERGGVTLDVYVCNFSADNSDKAQQLLDGIIAAFKPSQIQRNTLIRGDQDQPSEAELLWENINATSLYGFRFQRRLLTKQTQYQHLELLESTDLGVTLRLDGCMMTAENEEFFYHECLIHPAAIAHSHPRQALILGGGDGGALEELLKHNTIEKVVLVDLDAEVIAVAKQHLQRINKGALDSPRAQIVVGDGAAYVATATQQFDLIYLDLTDPETPAGPLYTPAFFEQCQRLLTDEGAMVIHLGAPFYEPAQIQRLSTELSSVFKHLSAYGLHIPLYGAYWAMAVVSDRLQPTQLSMAQLTERLHQRGIQDLNYYNPAVHGALFALPTYYQKLLPA